MKQQTFDSILASILKMYENNPRENINNFIEQICLENNLSKKDIQLLQEANSYIDIFTEKATDLEDCKNKGISRKSWILRNLDNITEGVSEKEKAQVISAISETNETIINKKIYDK